MKTALANSLFFGLLILSGCTPYLHQPLRISNARLGAETAQFQDLTTLPEPREKVIAAVYKFRDQTGQYKDSQTGASWSTAVTQGATSILLRALEESGWFIAIEREGLSNLLNERKIIRSSIANYNEKEGNQLLPPLAFAGIILEGGIISFDSNIMTGGAGARYFGTGASTQYREDRITIYLRAVSTSNGRILKTVYTSKTILSQQIDIGIFRYVSTRRLLEAETGFTFNEPAEMAVKEAIEKAVYSLVVEGLIAQLWEAKDMAGADSTVMRTYISEENDNRSIDAFGNALTSRRSAYGIGIRGTGLLYEGDYTGSEYYPGVEINADFFANRRWSVGLQMGAEQGGTGEEFNVTLGYVDAGMRYRFFNQMRTTPYVRAGIGVAGEINNSLDNNNKFFTVASAELGMEYLITDKIGLNGSMGYLLFLNDDVDRLVMGKYNDSMWKGNIGITYYFKKGK